MQEKQKELFDQYDVELLHVRRGRGGLIGETPMGSYDLQICQYSPKRLEQAFQIKEVLIDSGFRNVDQYVRSREGELLVYDRYQTSYIMKRHFDGRECDIRNRQDIRKAAGHLAILHQSLKAFPIEGYIVKKIQFQQKNRELLRTRQYIAKKNEKKEFETLFQRYFSLFWDAIRTQKEEIAYIPAICHGSYHHHHVILLSNKDAAVIQFENFYAGNQMDDLFYLMRKVLEKNRYEFSCAEMILDAYQKEKQLENSDFYYLYNLLAYPEKYWKLANQYMNHRKSFLSPKLTEKLLEEVALQEKKKYFLSQFRLNYLQNYIY